MRCVWHNEWSGTFEFLCGRKRASELLSGGMTKVNNKPVMVRVVAEWEYLDAVQVQVSTSEMPSYADRA